MPSMCNVCRVAWSSVNLQVDELSSSRAGHSGSPDATPTTTKSDLDSSWRDHASASGQPETGGGEDAPVDDVTLLDLLGSLSADLHDLVNRVREAPAGMREVDFVEMEAVLMAEEATDEFGFAVAELVRRSIASAMEMLHE